VTALAEHFRAHPEEVPASVSLYIVPTINPDGLYIGTRFNANQVDLNRNMNTNFDSCPENDWGMYVQGARGIESYTGGAYVDSEPETRVARAFLFDAAGVIFYHSDGGDVFPAFCEHPPSITLAQRYAEATGYRYDRFWPNYMITGGMHDWAGSLGIAAITPELFTGTEPDFEENLAGVRMVLAHAEELLPLPADQEVNGIHVPALIWRFWQMHGGLERFGAPLAPPQTTEGLVRQYFERAVFELNPEQADTPYHVQLAPIGREAAAERFAPITTPDPELRYFPETGHTLRAGFLDYWERSEGQLLFGYPLSEEFEERTTDGQRRIVQYFERALLQYDDERGVTLDALGWTTLIREQLRNSPQAHQIR